jgi:hypothetical protein
LKDGIPLEIHITVWLLNEMDIPPPAIEMILALIQGIEQVHGVFPMRAALKVMGYFIQRVRDEQCVESRQV